MLGARTRVAQAPQGKAGERTALTRDFKDTVKARAERDTEFRVALLEEALDAFVNADLETGKVLLRDYVNATVGFEQLGAQLHKSPKSLMRMLSEQGNPRRIFSRPRRYPCCSLPRARPTNGSDRGSLRSHDLTLFVIRPTRTV